MSEGRDSGLFQQHYPQRPRWRDLVSVNRGTEKCGMTSVYRGVAQLLQEGESDLLHLG